MPHSSGGGSHSGSSGGGYSFSSSGGGGSSSCSSASSHRISANYFSGARRYVYYRKKRPVYVYIDRDSTIAGSKSVYKVDVIVGAAGFVFLAILVGLFVYLAIRPAKMLEPSEHNLTSLESIYDEADIFTDTSNLEKSLNDFQEKTGIIPVVLTVTNETWNTNYKSLGSYAFDYYLKLFDDEKCWLIVYSEPAHPDLEFNDWYWEGMQGNDTDGILTDSIINEFNNTMQGLLLKEDCSTEDAVSQAFDAIYPELRQWGSKIDIGAIIPILLFFGIGVLFCCCTIKNLILYIKCAKAKDAVPCNQSYQNPGLYERTCDYCGGVYVRGTCENCPHCGANIPAETT